MHAVGGGCCLNLNVAIVDKPVIVVWPYDDDKFALLAEFDTLPEAERFYAQNAGNTRGKSLARPMQIFALSVDPRRVSHWQRCHASEETGRLTQRAVRNRDNAVRGWQRYGTEERRIMTAKARVVSIRNRSKAKAAAA